MSGDIFKQGSQYADNGMPLVKYITHTGVILQTLLVRYNVSGWHSARCNSFKIYYNSIKH